MGTSDHMSLEKPEIEYHPKFVSQVTPKPMIPGFMVGE